jgi:hypothetical protein
MESPVTLSSSGLSLADNLRNKLHTRTARVGIVGLGYVGLPLAVELARAGFHATGIDVDARKVAAINRGESYIQDVPTADVATLLQAGRIGATTDAAVIKSLDTINICVPTPLRKTKDPDLSYVVSAVEMIADPRPIPARRTRWSGRSWNAKGWSPGETSSWRFRRSESIQATRNG